ncbi:hypothetical protein VTN00DRAFT_7256 [Thermoascus crustaceus]|uniref:uncharacterized protein n=1 Tax=Thermoascus crustaceus TaxID=5088 RepID=UPI003742E838
MECPSSNNPNLTLGANMVDENIKTLHSLRTPILLPMTRNKASEVSAPGPLKQPALMFSNVNKAPLRSFR